MAQRAGRVTCPRCGANNFDTVTSCWKCGAPVGASGAAPQASAPMAPMSSAPLQQSPAPSPAPFAQERAPAPAYSQPAPVSYPAPVPTGDTGVARRAAIALGLTIPFVGLPVGWVFMMLDDRNKQAIGRWCANASLIGLVVHLALTYIMIQNTVPFMTKLLLPIVEAAARRGAPSPESMPGGGGMP